MAKNPCNFQYLATNGALLYNWSIWLLGRLKVKATLDGISSPAYKKIILRF